MAAKAWNLWRPWKALDSAARGPPASIWCQAPACPERLERPCTWSADVSGALASLVI